VPSAGWLDRAIGRHEWPQWLDDAHKGRYGSHRDGRRIRACPREFPQELLHPSIADAVWSAFMRGDLDEAVFKAFKTVEVAVRQAAKLASTDIGVDLMRKAFDPDKGSLTRAPDPQAERQALSHLFAGAIGSYKNPHSHRT
jgi:uncharacterized protein (TIGR02391 family)